jgi:hypothetical protein
VGDDSRQRGARRGGGAADHRGHAASRRDAPGDTCGDARGTPVTASAD